MTDREKEDKPAAVSEETKQAGEIRARWAWVEPSVWTERMLTALEEGIKGGKWFSLMDKIYGRLSMKLCLIGNSSGLLKTRLKHGIELRKSRGDAAGNGSPSTLLQR